METDDDRPIGPNGSEPIGEHVRIYLRGRNWHATYQAHGKQHRVSLQTTKKKVAERKAQRINTELANGLWKPSAEIWTVEEAVTAYTAYLKAEDRAPKTLSKYAKVFERVIKLASERRVRDLMGIDHTFMDAYKQMRTEDGIKTRTRYTEVVIIRQLINFALVRKKLDSDPLHGMELKKPKPTKQPCWTREQVVQILAATPIDVRPALTLLAETGMRFGELAWLTWEDVDLKTGNLHVRPKDGWRLKTGDERSMPLSASARAVIEALPRKWRWVVTMPPTSVTSKGGQQWTERRLLTALKRVLKAIGLVGKLHTFRHAFISYALLTRTPVPIVKKWVGHVDPRVIDLYTHVHDEASQAAMQRLSEADSQLHQPKETKDGPEKSSAQSQHTDKEVENE